jgi:hypothetical protein
MDDERRAFEEWYDGNFEKMHPASKERCWFAWYCRAALQPAVDTVQHEAKDGARCPSAVAPKHSWKDDL